MAKKEKTPIKIGDQVYGVPTDNPTEKPVMGTVTGYSDVVKKYAVEWSAGADSRESYETESFVRAAKFSMKVLNSAMGLDLPQDM